MPGDSGLGLGPLIDGAAPAAAGGFNPGGFNPGGFIPPPAGAVENFAIPIPGSFIPDPLDLGAPDAAFAPGLDTGVVLPGT